MQQHVVVIGGGIVGVSTGIWLRRQGVDVTVIDRLGWGQGTSHGNGGVLAACAMVPVTGPGLWPKAPGMLMNPDYPLFLRWSYLPKLMPWLLKYMSHANDEDTQRIAVGLGAVVCDTVEQHLSLSKDTRAAPWVVESDYSYAYASRQSFEADAYSWAIRAKNGFVPVLREGAEAREYEPCFGPDVTFLATLKNHGYIKDPSGYVAALGQELIAMGGKLVVADVKDFDLGSGHVRAVDTTEGRIDCTEVVLATGAWSKPLMKKLGIAVPLESERGYHLVFKNAKGGPSHPTMIAAGKFVATPMSEGLRCAGIVEFGGLEAGPSKAPFALLRRYAKAAFPNLTYDDEIEWQGHRPATTDSLPLIGQIRDTGVYAGFGHQHIGLTAGPKTGRLLAQLISGQQPNIDLTPYAPTRFA